MPQPDAVLRQAPAGTAASHWMPAGGGTLDRATFDKARRLMEAQQASEDAQAVDLDALAEAAYVANRDGDGQNEHFAFDSEDAATKSRWRLIVVAVLMAANIRAQAVPADTPKRRVHARPKRKIAGLERMAHVAHDAFFDAEYEPWDSVSDVERSLWHQVATAVIDAITTRPGERVPIGNGATE